jgi:hypothetical protein
VRKSVVNLRREGIPDAANPKSLENNSCKGASVLSLTLVDSNIFGFVMPTKVGIQPMRTWIPAPSKRDLRLSPE